MQERQGKGSDFLVCSTPSHYLDSGAQFGLVHTATKLPTFCIADPPLRVGSTAKGTTRSPTILLVESGIWIQGVCAKVRVQGAR